MPSITLGRVTRAVSCALAAALILGGGSVAFAEDEPSTSSSVSSPPPSSPESSSAPSSSPVSSSGESPAPAPDLKITVSAPDKTLINGDQVPLTVTITNNGTADATKVRGNAYGSQGFGFSTQPETWGAFSILGSGGTLAAGASKTLTVTGLVGNWTSGDSVAVVYVDTNGDATLGDNSTRLTLDVVPASTTDSVGGVLFGDANDNGTLDPGEALSGAPISLSPRSGGLLNATTGPDGRFSFVNVPAGIAYLHAINMPDGWVLSQETLRVDGSGQYADLKLAAKRPLSDTLGAKIEFTAPTYAPGDIATLKVTLTNSGSVALTGVTADCNRAGLGPHIEGWTDPAHFGELRTGATIGAGETKTFTVTGTVPADADNFGYTYAGCDFGSDPDAEGRPEAYAQAQVPGKSGGTTGQLFQDKDGNHYFNPGESVEGLKVGIAEPDTGKVLAKAVTDGEGRVSFTNVPAGNYRLHVYGPWALVKPDSVIPVMAVGGPQWMLEVKPGPDQPDTDEIAPAPVTTAPTTPPTAPPSPPVQNASNESTGGLAFTGVNAIAMSAVGLLVLAAGIGAVLFARRKRAA